MDTDTLIGRRLFIEGSTRNVYRDAEVRYVLYAGCPAYGHWLLTEDDGPDFADWNDMPLIVAARTGGG